jgi:hypothetical protein
MNRDESIFQNICVHRRESAVKLSAISHVAVGWSEKRRTFGEMHSNEASRYPGSGPFLSTSDRVGLDWPFDQRMVEKQARTKSRRKRRRTQNKIPHLFTFQILGGAVGN